MAWRRTGSGRAVGYLALALVAVLACVLGAGSSGARSPVVILLSWDGVRHDYVDLGRLPGLERMQAQGLRAERLIPVFPSTTFPNHVALATGARTDRHGIVDNRFWDRERGLFDYSNDASWIEAEPLWISAERQGVRSAVFFWVGSETDWGDRGASYRKSPFKSGVREKTKVNQILEWLDLPDTTRPGLIMSYWRGADSVGHRKGPVDPDIAEQLRGQDRQLLRLLEGLDAREAWADTTLIIVSDHGMAEVTAAVPLRGTLRAADVAAQVQGGSAVTHVFLANPADLERAEQALTPLEGIALYRRGELPAELRMSHPTRNGDLIAIAEPGRSMSSRLTPALLASGSFGAHGYDPTSPDMGAIFLALGRGIPAGTRIDVVRAIDVAPTVSHLLGIDPPLHSEGELIDALGPTSPTGAAGATGVEAER